MRRAVRQRSGFLCTQNATDALIASGRHAMQALLHQCRSADFILMPQQMLPSMLNSVSTIVDSASSIFTFIRSQLPYPYVHLVSLTVHFYLFFWATYMGCLMRVGVPDDSVTQTGEIDSAQEPLSQGKDKINMTMRFAHSSDNWFTVLWTYVTIAFANATFHGLLLIHPLLDSSFGDHCCQFPLRAQINEMLNATRTLLCRADDLPSIFTEIFDTHLSASRPGSQATTRTVCLSPIDLTLRDAGSVWQ
jgi:hypothetical protein